MPLYPKKPQVVLVVGVNGSGKTTTIGKLASQFRAAGKSVVIAAGDTFRAAAVEQLQVWGERAGVPVMTAPEGSDPASLAFDAMTKAEAEGADLLMIDTAGRLQNRADLMEELAKIVRVIRKKDPDAAQHAARARRHHRPERAQPGRDLPEDGRCLGPRDDQARRHRRGGVLVALADKFGLPIHAIGVGEQIDDLAPFDPEEFARALTGAARAVLHADGDGRGAADGTGGLDDPDPPRHRLLRRPRRAERGGVAHHVHRRLGQFQDLRTDHRGLRLLHGAVEALPDLQHRRARGLTPPRDFFRPLPIVLARGRGAP
jgi:energy-coupling factor transporter ATP-binding protein EcfA2